MMISALQFVYAVAGMLITLYAVSIALSVFSARGGKIDSISPTADFEWPVVTVQLPIRNEAMVVRRLLEAVCSLDYPAEKLQIQLLDDSSDQTSEIVDDFIAHLPAGFHPVEVVRRPERSDYKTGALRYALPSARGSLITVFDADFVPGKDFLKKVIPYFSLSPKIAFIQTRWGYLNEKRSVVTMVQTIALDVHFALEKPSELQQGLFINYNGSAAVWRKEAIVDCGGWPVAALSEDLNLSYRAQLRGWQAYYLKDVEVPSELPTSLYILGLQQERWAFGALQVLRKVWKEIFSAPLSAMQRIQVLMILSGYGITNLLVLQLLLIVPFITLSLPFATWPLWGTWLLTIGNGMAGALSQMRLYPDWPRRLLYVPAFAFLTLGMSVRMAWGVLVGLTSHRYEFVRTPKSGETGGSQPQQTAIETATPRQQRWLSFVVVEFLLGLYALFGFVLAMTHHQWLAGSVLALYIIGYFYVACASILEMRHT